MREPCKTVDLVLLAAFDGALRCLRRDPFSTTGTANEEAGIDFDNRMRLSSERGRGQEG